MTSQVFIMTICDGMALLITVQNDDDDARHQGSLVTPICHITNDSLQHHFSSIFSNSLKMLPLAGRGIIMQFSKKDVYAFILAVKEIIAQLGLILKPVWLVSLTKIIDLAFIEKTWTQPKTFLTNILISFNDSLCKDTIQFICWSYLETAPTDVNFIWSTVRAGLSSPVHRCPCQFIQKLMVCQWVK